MARANENYLKLAAGYLFPEIARRVEAFLAEQPSARTDLLRCGIGDVTEPLTPTVVAALRRAVDEMGRRETFRGYGPPTGHTFVREAIAKGDFADRGIEVGADEIFLSDGSKPDASAFLSILGRGNVIAVADPVYPVYVDTNVMAGNTGSARADGGYEGILYLPTGPEGGFLAEPPRQHADIVYLCSPGNPTGAVATKENLTRWVDWARAHDALILFDAAYEAFIRDPNLPHSIYEIPGARECAVEFRSFSKNGGFTGLRCGYTVCPTTVTATAPDGSRIPLHRLWTRRWSTCSNGVSYVVQCAAAALYTPEGIRETRALVDFYLGNAAEIRRAALGHGLEVFGGEHAPYVWIACPKGMRSWDAFDLLLREAHLVITPGAGFGGCGEGFIRVSGFNSRENAIEAGRRLRALSRRSG